MQLWTSVCYWRIVFSCLNVFVIIINNLVSLNTFEWDLRFIFITFLITSLIILFVTMLPINTKFSFHHNSKQSNFTRKLNFLHNITLIVLVVFTFVYSIWLYRKYFWRLNGFYKCYRFQIELMTVIENEKCWNVGQNLMDCCCKNLCIILKTTSEVFCCHILNI